MPLSSIFLLNVIDPEVTSKLLSDCDSEDDEDIFGSSSQGVGAGLLLKYLCCNAYEQNWEA